MRHFSKLIRSFLVREKFLPSDAKNDDEKPIDDNGEDEATGAPKPLTEEEAYLSEYYKNYYAQLYAQSAADYQKQVQEYEAAQKQQAEKEVEASAPPDDGYQIPRPQFEEYRVTGQFAKVRGRFMAEGTGGSEYWAAKGTQGDREGRQLDHYYDVNAFQNAMSEGRVQGNAPDKSKAKKKMKTSHVPSWMADDPLEGAFRKAE